jgi:hypothetical protein
MATTELDADTVEAIGLDATGRDGSERFPYTLENLHLEELANVILLEDEHWCDAALEELSRRLQELK